ncbi:unnamed protein product [Symbiodinium natans]|uniref:Uncharacterized protein n=1 Tax=Symbiodinium natans TaxID=878477 RepID=A0A812TDP3_9DINO|nr:unnamed protein product [Symbiodinium natans]
MVWATYISKLRRAYERSHNLRLRHLQHWELAHMAKQDKQRKKRRRRTSAEIGDMNLARLSNLLQKWSRLLQKHAASAKRKIKQEAHGSMEQSSRCKTSS